MISTSAEAKKYLVALSFAGEDRAYVEKVAAALRANKVKVFYDKYEEVELWGKNLYSHLSDIYANQAYFTVIFISKYYREKLWTNHERESAQSRAFIENQEYILPVRFDETEIPGILRTVGYLNLNDRSPEELAESIRRKLIERNLIRVMSVDQELSIVEVVRQAIAAAPSLPAALSSTQAQSEYAIRAANDYIERCHRLYQNMRILAMPKPVELSHIFTQVRVADRIRGRQVVTEAEMIKEIISKRGSKERTGLNAVSLFEKRSRSVLLGRPGSGKSTFMKYMLLRELQRESILQIPILIPLNELDQRAKSIFGSLSDILAQSEIEYPELLLKALLSSGRLRLLIDGLDELRSDDRKRVIEEIEELMLKYEKCSFLITCRTAAYEYWFGDCRHYEVQSFSRRSIIAFVLRWFSKEKKKARELLSQILENSRMRDLCSSPLMLTIVCIGFDEGIDLSNNRAEIYKDAIDALLRKWDASRSIYRDNVYRSLTPKRREDLLCDLAARTFVDNQIVIPAAQAEELVSKFLKTMPTSSDVTVEDDAVIVLRAIEVQHGLIEQRSVQFWAFAHLTFQEFFVSQYLVSRDPDLRSHVASTYIDRPEWREVIMLTAALLPNADDFVLEILKALTKIGYGEFFVRQTLAEIKLAQQSVEYKRFQSESLFPRNDFRSMKYRQPAFGVVEGGYRLTVEEIQMALSSFREGVGPGGSAPNFIDLFGEDPDRDSELLAYIEYVAHNLANIKDLNEEAAREMMDTDNRLLRRGVRNILIDVEKLIVASVEKTVGAPLGPSQRIDLLKGIVISYNKFEQENAKASEKLNSFYEPNNLFELTARKHMFILPDCLDECLQAASGVISELKTSKTREAIRANLSKFPIAAHQVEQIILDSVSETVKSKIRRAAAKNNTEREKLRAFVAGDTLSEILMSQAFLTPIVREAGVRTLNNMVGNVPTPPDLPPAFEPEIGLRPTSNLRGI